MALEGLRVKGGFVYTRTHLELFTPTCTKYDPDCLLQLRHL